MPLDGSEFKFEIDEITKLLIAAREMVKQGWCQNAMRAQGGKVCIYGAIFDSAANEDDRDAALTRFADAIGWVGIRLFNDDANRTQKQVLDAFDRAIVSV